MPKKAAVSSILPPSSLPFSELRSSCAFASTGRWRSCALCRCRSGRDPASGYPLDCSDPPRPCRSSAPAPSTTCSAASAKASRGRKLSRPMAAYPPRFRLGELRVVIQVVDIGAPRPAIGHPQAAVHFIALGAHHGGAQLFSADSVSLCGPGRPTAAAAWSAPR